MLYYHSMSIEEPRYIVLCPNCGTKATATAEGSYEFPDDSFETQHYAIASARPAIA